jgi:AcrR family transcriptional regulator
MSAADAKNMSARRRGVLDVAARLFHERGFMGTSMDEIAEAVGLTKGSLYHHFDGKAQILAEIYEEAADFVLEHIGTSDPEMEPSRAIHELIRGIVILIGTRRYHVTVFYQEMRWVSKWLPSDDVKRLQAKVQQYVDYVEVTIERGIKAGTFKVVDAKVAAYGLIGMASWSYQWYNPDGPRSVDEITATLGGIYLCGLQFEAGSR